MQTRETSALRQALNRAAYSLALRPLWAMGNARQESTPILVSGSPRSGSTWLLEALERRFKARRNWEPIDGIEQHLDGTMGQRRFGLRPYLAPDMEDDELAPLLLDIVDGGAPRQFRRAWNTKKSTAANLANIARANRTIVKFTEAQRALPFIAARRDNPVIVILRNPLAVTASALSFAGERDFDNALEEVDVPPTRTLPPRLLADFPDLEAFARPRMTKAQYIALATVIDMLVPLRDARCRERCLFVSYETLRENPARMAELYAYCGDPSGLDETDIAAMAEPSARARAQTSLEKDKLPWADRMLPQEVEQALEIMKGLGIDWYSDTPGINAVHLERFELAQAVI
ncbi:MAG: sulfotransferase domain-containing protein [Pseudomonadota bacterium]